MSMLTAQVDELREKAKLLRTHADGLNAPYVVPSTKELMALTMLDSASRMEQAAYTIESLRDRLQAATLGTEINGETSDGYHTFNELYHHRAVLFSVVVAANSGRAWKSKLHHDGTMYEGMFIVGVDTPQGQATYHYDVEPYWDMFWCRELERAPEWDGHTPDDAIERIGLLRDVVLKGSMGRW